MFMQVSDDEKEMRFYKPIMKSTDIGTYEYQDIIA